MQKLRFDGDPPTMSPADANRYRHIVATPRDGQPMPLGGPGPPYHIDLQAS